MNKSRVAATAIVAAVIVPMLFQIAAYLYAADIADKAQAEIGRVNRNNELVKSANALSKSLVDASVAVGGYNMTKSPLFENRLDKCINQMPRELERLQEFVPKDAAHQETLFKVRENVNKSIQLLTKTKSIIDVAPEKEGKVAARHSYQSIRENADALQTELRKLTDEGSDDQTDQPRLYSLPLWFQLLAMGACVFFAFIQTIFILMLAEPPEKAPG